ncbi:hypothetical protein [Streptomyces gobitricini]
MSTTAAQAEVVRQFRDLQVKSWFGWYNATSDSGEVRFKTDSYVVSARIYLSCSGGTYYAFLRHRSREYFGGGSATRDTNEVTCSNGSAAQDWVAGSNSFSPTHGLSAVVQLCVSYNLGTWCSDEVEVFETPRQ